MNIFSDLQFRDSLGWFCGCKAPGRTEFLAPLAWIALMDVLKGVAIMFRPGQPRFGLLYCVWVGTGKKMNIFSDLQFRDSSGWFCGNKAPGRTEFLSPPAWIALMDVLKGVAIMFRPGQPRFGLLLCVWIGTGKKWTFFRPSIPKFFGLILWE